jgi:hypothetical protein
VEVVLVTTVGVEVVEAAVVVVAPVVGVVVVGEREEREEGRLLRLVLSPSLFWNDSYSGR